MKQTDTTTENTHSIGEILKLQRKRHNLTIRELASRTQLTSSFISQVEHGKSQPSLQSMFTIAQALQLPIQELLYGSSPKEPSTENARFESQVYMVQSALSPAIHLPDRNVTSQLRTPNMGKDLEVLFSTGFRDSGNTARQLNINKKEVIFVVCGTVHVSIGKKSYVLNAQDSIYFHGEELEEFRCETETASWLSIIAY
jgi:transcriptional regulator with XRE-family HTH domain